MHADEVRQLTAEWLDYARSDLTVAETMQETEAGRPRHVAYHAQQAAEKAIKALLVFEQIEFPFTHELDVLRDLAPAGSGLHSAFADLESLSRWAVRARYPVFDEPTQAEATDAKQLAAGVVRLVEKELDREGVK